MANKEQLKILINAFVPSVKMKKAVALVLIGKKSAYEAAKKYDLPRSTVYYQVQLMRRQIDIIKQFNAASDTEGGF